MTHLSCPPERTWMGDAHGNANTEDQERNACPVFKTAKWLGSPKRMQSAVTTPMTPTVSESLTGTYYILSGY